MFQTICQDLRWGGAMLVDVMLVDVFKKKRKNHGALTATATSSVCTPSGDILGVTNQHDTDEKVNNSRVQSS